MLRQPPTQRTYSVVLHMPTSTPPQPALHSQSLQFAGGKSWWGGDGECAWHIVDIHSMIAHATGPFAIQTERSTGQDGRASSHTSKNVESEGLMELFRAARHDSHVGDQC
mmetsp:Transcript_44946/g.119164  ORF Transcript_44946/g.119164 Transcript_44946/m.119164 type:complete len:110 (-) Transcript_44946:229-558(-)